jgi:hypothetical protein
VRDLTDSYAIYVELSSHAVWHHAKRQYWMWVAPAASGVVGVAGFVVVLSVDRTVRDGRRGLIGGWAKYTGDIAEALSSVMYGAVAAGAASADLTPHISPLSSGDTGEIWRCDAAGQSQDDGADYQAYVETKPLQLGGPRRMFAVADAVLTSRFTGGTTLQVSLIRDFGLETRTASRNMATVASETRVTRKVEDAQMDGASFLAFRVGDASATSAVWALDQLEVKVDVREDR